MRKQRGFTLIELAVVMVVLGIVSSIMSPIFGELISSNKRAYDEKHKLNNQLIGAALQNFAANSTTNGRLPAAYTGGGYTSTIYDPASATVAGIALTNALRQNDINPAEINDDGTPTHNVRVYQVVQGLTQTMPLFFTSGPQVTLTYDYGAIYLSNCALATAACNPTAATGVPGSSVAMTAGNYTAWTVAGTDAQPFFVSSLPIQKQMLATTVSRLDRVRDAFLSFLRANQATAAGGDNTNWYPNDAGASSAGALSGNAPAGNQQCRDGWYGLVTYPSILGVIGLSTGEYGSTAWGGEIEYCRDYDPTGTKTPDAPPHYAAIRINSNVTAGGAPSATPGNNVVLTF